MQSDEHIKAASLRVQAAREHMAKAVDQINAANADLSSVVRADAYCRALSKLADQMKTVSRNLGVDHANDNALQSLKRRKSAWYLDHKPSVAELEAGHGDKHGCGGVA